MFLKNNFRRGTFVTLGYMDCVDMPKRIYPTADARKRAEEYIKQQTDLSDFELKSITRIIGDPNYKGIESGTLLNTKKEPRKYFDLSEQFPKVVWFKRYTFNFMDKESLKNNFETSRDAEYNLRKKYGFGKSEEEYPETDWRRKMGYQGRKKYRGLALHPEVDPRDVNKGSSYKGKFLDGNFPLYGDVDMDGNERTDPKLGYQKVALRQNISSSLKKHNTEYFILDNDGNLTPVNEKFINFISGNFKEAKSDENVAKEIEKEENDFATELDMIKNKYDVKQYITNQIAYMTATVIDDKTKEKKPIYFINNDINKLDGTVNMNPTQVRELINKYLKDKLEYNF
jgi:hypothetical protein